MPAQAMIADELRHALETDVLHACTAVLGCILVKGERRARIVEVEAYRSEDDPASHAFRGMTPRNEVMFGPPGLAYVYFTYGNHWMLNVTAHPNGRAAAVLVRAAEPLDGIEHMWPLRPKARQVEDLLSGPGKLAAGFGITGACNGMDLLDPDSDLHLEIEASPSHVVRGRRIGIAPGKGDELPWRFLDGDRLRWASRPLPRV